MTALPPGSVVVLETVHGSRAYGLATETSDLAKHASHLIRLLRMAGEILERGAVVVKRPDAAELRAIREGTLSYDELVAQAEAAESRLDALAAASALPERPDEAALDELCVRVVEVSL